VLAALVGASGGIVDAYSRHYLPDMSAAVVKDFGDRRSASFSYARGISPGNGTILTSTQEVITGSYSMLMFRHYNVSLSAGRSSMSSTVSGQGTYDSDFAGLNVSRTLPHNVSGSLGVNYRSYRLTGATNAAPQIVIVSTVSWGPGEGRLW
jgi:hypothetical protein